MKVLVTGASGFVGQEVVRLLHASGHSVRILVRDTRARRVQDMAARYHTEVHTGNVLETTSLKDSATGIDAVIHLIGIISEAGQNTFENVHARGTQNIIQAAQRAGVNRYVQMSALGTRPNAVARYHQSKWAAEEIVRASGLAYTIFRPSIIYGPQDEFVNPFSQMSRFSPVLPIMGTGQGKLQPIAVEAVAASFVRALKEPRSIGRTFDLCGPEIFTFEEILEQILEVTDRRRLKLHVPMGLARRLAAVLEFIFPKLLGKVPPLNRDQLMMLQEDNVGDPSPANGLLGLKQLSFREGIARYLKQ